MALARNMLMQSGAFILLLTLARPLLKRFLSGRARHGLWLIPALRLALPFDLASRLSLWRWLLAPAPLAGPLAPGAYLPAPALPLTGATQAAPAALPAASALRLAQPQAAPAVNWGDLWPDILLWAWGIGAAAMLLYALICHLRLKSRIRGLQPFHAPGVPLPLYVVPDAASPCLAGLLRPHIQLNRAAIQTGTLLDMVLAHEIAHWKRGDHLWAAFRSLLLCAWWWNPLVWLMAHFSREDSEAACDEAVTRGMDAARREAYGMSLIALMQTDLRISRLLAADTAMSCGKRHLKERIAMIASQKKKNRAAALVIALALTLIIPLLFTSGISRAEPALPDPAPADPILEESVPMTREEAVAAAQEAVMSHIVYDDGIQGFSGQEAALEWKQWGGIWNGMWVVRLDVTAGRLRERLEVRILPEYKSAVYIGQGDEPLWEGPSFMPEIPRSESRRAWVKGSAGMRHLPYSGDYPAMLLLPGAPVILTRVTPGAGGNMQEEWADITVGKTAGYAGVSGYVPLGDLAFEQPADAAFTGKIIEETKLLRDTGLSGEAAGLLPPGTEVTLRGRSLSYYHVQAGDALGYLPLSAVRLEDKTKAALSALLPEGTFDEVEPGWQERYAEFKSKLRALYNKNGAMGTWTLEQMAEGSRLAQEYGFEWISDGKGTRMTQVVPGPGELSPEEAYAAALRAAGEKYGFDESAVMHHNISYEHPEGSPEKREWGVRFWLVGVQDCYVRLDRDGKLMELRQVPGPVVGKNARVKKDQAVQIARDALIREGRKADEVDGWKTRLDYSSDFVEGNERELWEMSFHVPDAQGPGSAGSYIVRIDAMTGEVIEIVTPEGNG